LVKPLEQIGEMTGTPVDWCRFAAPVAYDQAVSAMEQRVADILAGKQREQIWLLEHPPLYTAGTSALAGDLLTPKRFPVHASGRGGQYTYHGPGQRICYVLLDLNRRGRDVRRFVSSLEFWIINTLAQFGVAGEIREGRVGVWVERPDKPLVNGKPRDDKIAAIGIRVRRWVSFHGLSLNVSPDLGHYSGIVPCGISDSQTGFGVTSLRDLGVDASLEDVDEVLKITFGDIFGSPLYEVDSAL
jgi:lipoyl(octanoyl) transferase